MVVLVMALLSLKDSTPGAYGLGASNAALLISTSIGTSPMDPIARGLAMGTASHGQGTARILQESEEAGALSSIAMGLTALTMAGTMPLLARLLLVAP
jgi:putative effector of murein hydrolase